MSEPIKTALVGFGKAGEYLHAPFIATMPMFELTTIVERTPKKAAQAYLQAKVVCSYEDVLKDPSIELIVLATPNETHAVMAEQALKHGKHVVIDKPFTVYAEEAKYLQRISHETTKDIFVYQNRRWDGDFLTVQKILYNNLLGDIISIESRFDRYRPEPRLSYWKESAAIGNGLWYDLGPHLMDQAFQLFGLPDTYIASVKKQRANTSGIDYFDVTFAYENMTYRIHAGMLEQEPTPRWAIKGTQGTYTKFGVDPQEARLNSGEQPVGAEWGKEDSSAYGTLVFNNGRTEKYPTVNGDYRTFYAGVYDSIRNDAAPLVSIHDAVELVGWLERLGNNYEL